MAVDVGTAFVSIVPSARGFARRLQATLGGELAQAGARAGAEAGGRAARSFRTRLLTGLAGFAGQLGVLLRSGFAIAAAAAATGIAAITTFGIKAAGSLEQTRIGFVSLLGSAREADVFLRKLQDFAAATPLEFPGIADAARNLLAVGHAAGITRDQIIPTLTVIGNLAATLGQSQFAIDGVVRALGQIASKGRVQAEELLQISEALPGFNAVAAIAAAKGISVAQAQELISRGAVSAKEGIAALLAGMAKFPGAADAMKRQSQTLLGVFSTFKDTVTLALVGGFDPVIPAIKQSLAQLTPVLQGAFQQLGPAIGQALAAVLPLLGDLAQGATAVLTPLLAGLAQAAKAIGPALKPLGVALGKIVQAAAPLFPVLGELAAVLAGVLAEALTAAAPLIGALARFLAQLLPHLARLIPPLVAALTPAFTALGEAVVALLPALLPLIPPLTDILIALAPLITLAAQLAAALLDVLVPAIAPLVAVVARLAGWLTGPLATAIAGIGSSLLGPFLRSLRATAAGFGKFLAAFVGPVRTVKTIVLAVFGAITDGARRLKDGFVTALKAIPNAFISVINFVIRLWNKLADTFSVDLPGGRRIGLPKIREIPHLAAGGIVPARPGGTLAVLGEREDELVVPLSRLHALAAAAAPAPVPPVLFADVFIGAEPIARRVRAEVSTQVGVQARALRRGRTTPTGDL